MYGKMIIATGVLAISTGAFASEVMDKCVAAVTPIGADDPEGECACFEDNLSKAQAKEYLNDVDDWEADASDEMKEIGVMCFPELN